MMLKELQRRNYSQITTHDYLPVVADFAKYFAKSPDKLGPYELRTYQAYLLRERKVTPGTAVNCVAALRFFFVKTLERHQFGALPDKDRHASRSAQLLRPTRTIPQRRKALQRSSCRVKPTRLAGDVKVVRAILCVATCQISQRARPQREEEIVAHSCPPSPWNRATHSRESSVLVSQKILNSRPRHI
jgi:hypothetical protein